MLWRGEQLENLREIMALLRLNEESDAIRFLVHRGMEAMANQLHTRRMILRMEQQFSPQQMLPLFEKLMAGPPS
jgi:hypothetical protein